MKSGIEIGTRSFTADDQRWFAAVSRDRNPMHMDAVYARRTPAGAPVVHGMHLLATALELALTSGTITRIEHVRVKFPLSVTTGQEVRFIAEYRQHFVRISARVADSICATFDVLERAAESGPVPVGPSAAELRQIRAADIIDAHELTLDAMEGKEWQIEPSDHPSITERFPRLAGLLGRPRLVGLAMLSFVVGMVCPGLYSIFAGADISFIARHEPVLRTKVISIDPRFRKVVQEVRGCGLSGAIEAFSRIPPVVQPSIAEIRKLVAPNEFSGCHALVVGGSRGLGEIAAKVIAAAGGTVSITYAVGRSDASTLVDELCSADPASAHRALQFDVRRDDPGRLLRDCSPITHLLYFASPRITMRRTADVFDWNGFQSYAEFYIGAFARLLEASRPDRKTALGVLYPSSSFVEDIPPGFCEYAAAKAAGEALCHALDREKLFAFSVPRYPRLLTDQTASVVPVQMESAAAIVLASIRSLESRRREKDGLA